MQKNDCDIAHEGVCKLQTQLNMINPELFPILPSMSHEFDNKSEKYFVEAESNLTYVFRCGKKGKKGFLREKCVTYKSEEYKQEVFQTEESKRVLRDVQAQCLHFSASKQSTRQYC